jgi:hypothetical protein
MCEREKARQESESRDEFGFDELLNNDQRGSASSQLKVPDTKEDVHARLQSMRKYLPSQKNKGRDRNIFPTTSLSPMKRTAVFNEPSTSSASIGKFFSSSTPIARSMKPTKAQSFADMSEIEETSEMTIDETQEEETNANLFQDQSDLYNNVRRIHE